MNLDEFEHQTTVDDWEIVGDGEPSLEDYPTERQETETHYADGTQKLDEFGAPIRKAVRVREGVKDRPASPPR